MTVCHGQRAQRIVRATFGQRVYSSGAGDGLVACCEIMIATQAVRRQIRENATHQLYSELQAGRRHGMRTMDRALLDLYQAGEIGYDAAIAIARDPESIKRRAS